MGLEITRKDELNQYEAINHKSSIRLWLNDVVDGVIRPGLMTLETLFVAVTELVSAAMAELYAPISHEHPEYAGGLESLEARIAALETATPEAAAVPIGAWMGWFCAELPEQYVWLHGETIGHAASGAVYAHDGLDLLFTSLWNAIADAWCPVSGGRGASAAADFSAGKTLTLPDFRSRSPMGKGQGSGLSNRVLGAMMGEEEHLLTIDEMPAHFHGVTANASGKGSLKWLASAWKLTTTEWQKTSEIGGGETHNNIQPTIVSDFIMFAGVTL